MKIPSYLQRNRYGIFHFRRAVPRHLREAIGKRELIRSLKTREPREAVQLGRLFAIQVEHFFQEARMEKNKDIRTNWTLEYKPDGSTSVTIEPEEIIKLKEAGYSDESITKLINPQAYGSASLQHQNIANVNDPHLNANSTGIKLDELIDKFTRHRIDERGGTWSPPKGDTTKLRRLLEIIGAETPLDSIDTHSAERVRNELIKLPNNTTSFKKQTVSQILFATKDNEIDRLSKKSLNDHLELYSRLFKYARSRQYIKIDPFEGVRVKLTAKEKVEKAREAFTRDEIKAIFTTPLHTESKTSLIYRYWTPLIALYSGARRGEIASLHLNDIIQINEIWIFDFNENTQDKRIKTRNGFRHTPIHPKLIDLGLLKYIDNLKKRGEKRLFPELKNWTEKEGYGRPIGDWFRDHLQKVGVYKKNKKVFHSFRHNVTTELRRAGADSFMVEQICGRYEGTKTVGESFYTEDDKIEALHDALSKVNFSNELENIKPFKHINSIV